MFVVVAVAFWVGDDSLLFLTQPTNSSLAHTPHHPHPKFTAMGRITILVYICQPVSPSLFF